MIELTNESMSKHTTFRTGGNAAKFVIPESVEELKAVIRKCKEDNEKYLVIGNGSNLLVSDRGFDGTVIQIADKLGRITVNAEEIYAEAGAMLSAVARVARDNSLTGMEFASGIPGSAGGAAYMNAGAYGGEMKDIITYVDVIVNNEFKRMTCEEMEFGYRHSAAMEQDMIVTGISIKLRYGDKDKITAEMSELSKKRVEKQPLEYPSAGSTFKRPTGHFAGKLIEDTGLRGYRVGDAMVSDKHCGFVVNVGNATSDDIYQLICDVKEKVYAKFGVELEPEVRLIGEFE
ncbi:UDP-N-acetylmuramate dehydrogenase [Eubacterium ruminantium]|nr:UDP-N-acetylmuramate dehydrogenase [Eubacterium ruminantium]